MNAIVAASLFQFSVYGSWHAPAQRGSGSPEMKITFESTGRFNDWEVRPTLRKRGTWCYHRGRFKLTGSHLVLSQEAVRADSKPWQRLAKAIRFDYQVVFLSRNQMSLTMLVPGGSGAAVLYSRIAATGNKLKAPSNTSAKPSTR